MTLKRCNIHPKDASTSKSTSGTPYAKMGNTKQWMVPWHLTQPYLSFLTQVSHVPSVAGHVVLGLGFITTKGGIVPSHNHWQVQHSTIEATSFPTTMESQKKILGCGQSYNQIIYGPIVAEFKYDVLRTVINGNINHAKYVGNCFLASQATNICASIILSIISNKRTNIHL